MSTERNSSILARYQFTDAQRAAVTGRQPTIAVTAGAGSGKTLALVGRFLALLEAGLPLRSLVAITFTDKAAREMRNRVRAAITDWLGQVPDADRQLWAEAFSAMDAARISTIHGLCAQILRAHPAEAGLDPAFEVMEEGRSAVSQARAVEESLASAATEPALAGLFSLYPEGQLRRLLADLLANRLDAEQAFARTPGPGGSPLDRWAAVLAGWFDERLAAPAWQDPLETLAALQARSPDDKLELARQSVLAHWREARQALAAGDWDGLFAALPALRAAIATGGQKGNWAAADLDAARAAMSALRTYFDEALSGLIDKNKPLRWSLDEQAAGVLPLVRRLFERARDRYRDFKNETRSLDFDDLEERTAGLLTGNDAVRARWQAEVRAILVDEFQDTNHRQRAIVYALAGFGEGDGNPAAPPASLFVVGDAKQSIYRFRGADVAVFRQVQADVRVAGGALIDFDLTFRAHRPLVEIVNALLAPLMPAADDPARPFDVPFSPLTAHRPAPAGKTGAPHLEFHLGLGDDLGQGRQAAAAALARRLHELQRAGQIDWQEVALLFRASTTFGIYEDALEAAGIPYVTVAGRGFYDRPEVRDLLNALAAISDPGDDLAVAGLLRSPAIGLSDPALYLLRRDESGARRPFWPALQSEAVAALPEAERGRAEFARRLIGDLHRQVGRVPVAQLLKTFLDATQYRAALGLVPGGERLRRNVDKLLADAHRSELVSVAEFLVYIAALRDVAARESEAPTEAGGAVQLMTIHKAKGLEFPLVVLADAGAYGGHARGAPFYLDPELGLALDLSDGEAWPATARLAAWRDAAEAAAEEQRLLYVAATRAREKLIVSGAAKLSTARSNPGRLLLGGALKQLAGVVGLSEVELPTPPAEPLPLPLDWGGDPALVACTLYPWASPAPGPAPGSDEPAPLDLASAPDLLAPLAAVPSFSQDEKTLERDADPPRRVWRVVPKRAGGVPAWVVGSLTHTALRRWRFPDEAGFDEFLRPYALEAGLADPASVEAALKQAADLLRRFQATPLYEELAAAERHHEVPFALTVDGQRSSGVIDLLYRSAPEAPWTIVEFKTDRLARDVDPQTFARKEGYLDQVRGYVRAAAQPFGAAPRALLVFLNAGGSVRVVPVGP